MWRKLMNFERSSLWARILNELRGRKMEVRKGKTPEEIEQEGLEDPPPLLPPRSENLPNFDMGGAKKTAVISLVVTCAILLLMSFAGGVMFVTKNDFTTNMADMAITLDQATVGLAKAKSDVATAVQGIPTTISAQVNTAISQSTGQWNNQVSSLSDRINTLSNSIQGNTAKVGELTTKLDATNVEVVTLKDRLATLQAEVANYGARIASLESSERIIKDDDDVLTMTTSGDEAFYTVETPSGSGIHIARVGTRVTLTNNISQDIEDIIVEIPVYISYSGGDLHDVEMDGQPGFGNWYIKDKQWRSFTLRNGTRMDIDAGDREKFYFDFILTFDNAVSSGDLIIDEDDIELIDYDLDGQSSTGSVIVDSTVRQYIITSGVARSIPCIIDNNSNSDVNVPVKLVLTAPSGIGVTSATINGVTMGSISGSTVTFYTSGSVEADTRKQFDAFVILTYTGTSPNTWSARWSKQ